MTYPEIKTILSQITDPAERLEFVMELGARLPMIPKDAKATEIKGCASRVEIYRDSANHYSGTADSALVRGVLAILLSMVQGKSAAQIRDMNPYGEFASLHLNLGSGRMNGVNGMIEFLVNNE